MRKLIRNKRGWMRILEAVLASMLIFSSLLYMTNIEMMNTNSRPEWDRYTLKMYGQDALRTFSIQDLDSSGVGDLIQYVTTDDWNSVGVQLNSTLHALDVEYSLFSYNPAGVTSFRTGQDDLPPGRERVTVYYIIPGNQGQMCKVNAICGVKLLVWYMQ